MSGLKVHLELTNICNLACAYCPKYAMRRKSGYMDKDLAVRIIDELAGDSPKPEKLFFHLMGEPLLHPDIVELTRYAVKKELPLSLYSNGSMLKGDCMKSILAAGPEELVISIQTPDKESFSLRRDQLSYDQYLDNINSLILEKRHSNARTKIELRILNTSRNNILSQRFWSVDKDLDLLSDKNKMKAFLDALSLKLENASLQIDVKQILDSFSLARSVFKAGLFKDIFLVGTPYFSWYNFEDARDKDFKKAFIGSCDAFRKQVGILYDGSVTSCCVDYDGNNTVGNVKHKSLKEVLAGKQAREFRKKLDFCILPTQYCRICRGAKKARVLFAKQIGSILVFNLGRITEGK